MRILGLDPGVRNTGWGVIDAAVNRLAHVAKGVVRPMSAPAWIAGCCSCTRGFGRF